MAELTLREIDPEIASKLKERAEENCRSIEDEHKAMLRETLLCGSGTRPQATFEQYLRLMPDVGTDDDFSRIEGSIRAVDLTN